MNDFTHKGVREKDSYFSKLSVQTKIIISIVLSGLLGVILAYVVISFLYIETSYQDFKSSKLEITQLMANNVSGAIRWNRKKVVEKSYQSLVKNPLKPISFAAAIKVDMTVVSQYKTKDFPSSQIISKIKKLSKQNKNSPTGFIFENSYVVVTPALNTKSNKLIGYLAIAWSTDSLNQKIQQNMTLITLTLIMIILFIVGALIVSLKLSIIKPLSQITSIMTKLSQGNLDVEIPRRKSKDEIKDMINAVVVFKDAAIEKKNLEKKDRLYQEAQKHRHEALREMIENFRQAIHDILVSAGSENDNMKNNATTLSEIANIASSEANTARLASTSATEDIKTVSKAAEELTHSITEIAQQSGKAKETTNNTAQTAKATNEEFIALAEAVERIGEIVNMISDIAEQTNLLALNATIEAARAGESGKGFAVVASEVKDLATQTAKATDEISQQISAVQCSTKGAVDAIASITSAIENILDVTTTIASAVEQQDIATKNIIHSIADAKSKSENALGDIESVTSKINDTNNEAQEVETVSKRMDQVVAKLSSRIESFLEDVYSDVDNRRKSPKVN